MVVQEDEDGGEWYDDLWDVDRGSVDDVGVVICRLTTGGSCEEIRVVRNTEKKHYIVQPRIAYLDAPSRIWKTYAPIRPESGKDREGFTR